VCVCVYFELFKQLTFTKIKVKVIALENTPTPYISFETLSNNNMANAQ